MNEQELQEIMSRVEPVNSEFICDNPECAVETIEWYSRIVPRLIEEVRRQARLLSEEPLEKKIEGLTLRLYEDEDGEWLLEQDEDWRQYPSYALARAAFDEIHTLEEMATEFGWDVGSQEFIERYPTRNLQPNALSRSPLETPLEKTIEGVSVSLCPSSEDPEQWLIRAAGDGVSYESYEHARGAFDGLSTLAGVVAELGWPEAVAQGFLAQHASQKGQSAPDALPIESDEQWEVLINALAHFANSGADSADESIKASAGMTAVIRRLQALSTTEYAKYSFRNHFGS